MDEGAATGVAWVVPVDDTHYFQLLTRRVKKGTPKRILQINGKALNERTEAERREFPGDYEAQMGQGPISLHTEEHLATSDRGIVMQRRFLERQMKIVMEGGDPVGVSFDPKKATVKVRSGNFFSTAQAAE
jgi:hypothetical protein